LKYQIIKAVKEGRLIVVEAIDQSKLDRIEEVIGARYFLSSYKESFMQLMTSQ